MIYYDGAANLPNALHIDCSIYDVVPNDCLRHNKCGWCGDRRACIPGDSSGPMGNCMRSTFLYTRPNGNWDPMKAGTINIYTGKDSYGRENLVIAPHPDMTRLKAIPSNAYT